MGHFFHAVGVFFHHLAAVQWRFLGLAIACHVAKLVLRAAAWCTIVRAAYPGQRLRYRTALGAYVAGVGVNSIVPARGGDLVKMYLVKHRLPGATYATLTPTLLVETLFDFFTVRRADHLGARERRAADAPALLAHPDGRLEVLPAPRAADRDRARRLGRLPC